MGEKMIKRYFQLLIVLFTMLIITGCLKQNHITVSFETNGGTEISSIIANENSLIDLSIEPTKEGHTFAGWFFDDETFQAPFTATSLIDSNIKDNIIVYAKWTVNTYTLTFNVDDGEEVSPITQEYSSSIKLPTTTKIGHTFKGWFIDEDLTNQFTSKTMPASNLNLYAKFEPIYYNVVFYDYYGKEIETMKIKYGDKTMEKEYQRPEDIRYKYDYKGWGTSLNSNTLFDFNSAIDSNLKLYPQYDKTKKIVDFRGLKVSFLGDSITTFFSNVSPVNSYYTDTNQFYYPIYSATVKSVADTWWHKLMSLAELELGINNSWSGSACYNFGNNSNSGAMNQHRIDTLKENGTPDLIFVHIGTNDNVNAHSDTIFRNSYKTMIERINKTYPEALIFVCTLGYSAYTGYGYTEERRLEYNSIIRSLAEEFDLYVVALDEVQTTSNYLELLGDNLHPNKTGMLAYAQKAYETLINELSTID